TDGIGRDGAPLGYLRASTWDPDDVFGNCHFSGSHAFPDPNELAYCAESFLDHRLLGDPVTYARYVDRLEDILDWLDTDRFGQEVEDARGKLLPWFSRADVCAASVELSAPAQASPEVAQQAIGAYLDGLKSTYAAR